MTLRIVIDIDRESAWEKSTGDDVWERIHTVWLSTEGDCPTVDVLPGIEGSGTGPVLSTPVADVVGRDYDPAAPFTQVGVIKDYLADQGYQLVLAELEGRVWSSVWTGTSSGLVATAIADAAQL